LEILEDRSLLSVCVVDRLTDNKPASGGEGGNGMGDLRWCVIESLFQADTITFAVTGTINLAAGLPTLTRSVNIEGPGADLVTVRRDTGGDYRIFQVAAGVTVGIAGLTITNGGGGIHNSGMLTVSGCVITANVGDAGIWNDGTLTVSNSTVSGNSISVGNSRGGGIYNENGAIATVINSTISGNTAGFGAGIANGYGLSLATLTVINSTISGNATLGGGGGGIDNWGNVAVSNSTIWGNSAGNAGGGGGGGIRNIGTLTVNNSTIAGNTATNPGGGIYAGTGESMQARNTIIAGNTAPAGPDVYGNLGSQGHNLVSNPQDMSGWVDTDLLHVDPQLGPLQDNGGPTPTMALLPGSLAIDAGDNTDAPDWDQRGEGFPRIVGIIDPNNPVIDIGAFEVQTSGGPGRATSPHAQPVHPDVAALLSPAVLPSRAPLSSPPVAKVPTQGTLPGHKVAVLDGPLAWLNQRDAAFDIAQPIHQAHAETSRGGLDLLRGDEPPGL
jgi:hypothetical protein